MKPLDRVLQHWRIAKVQSRIPQGARVLDVGCADGALFRQCKGRIGEGVGIDPALDTPVQMEQCKLLTGRFPQDLPAVQPFDVITMLAVLEHIPVEEQPGLALACARLLNPGGSLLITIPSPLVDHILSLLKWMRLIDGMADEQHYGFDPHQTPSLFAVEPLLLVKAEKFQFGLNNLYLFQKSS